MFTPGDSHKQASLGNTEFNPQRIIVRIKGENKALFSLLLLLLLYIEGVLL